MLAAGPIEDPSPWAVGWLDHNAVMSADSDGDLLERLFAVYEGRHSIAAIEHITAQCRTELAGQTPPGAQLELLERLARQRVDDLPPSLLPH